MTKQVLSDQIVVRVDPRLRAQLEQVADAHERRFADELRKALKDWVAAHGRSGSAAAA